MIYDPTRYAQEIALARKLIAYGAQKKQAKRRARLVGLVRLMGKAAIVAAFFTLYILALSVEPIL